MMSQRKIFRNVVIVIAAISLVHHEVALANLTREITGHLRMDRCLQDSCPLLTNNGDNFSSLFGRAYQAWNKQSLVSFALSNSIDTANGRVNRTIFTVRESCVKNGFTGEFSCSLFQNVCPMNIIVHFDATATSSVRFDTFVNNTILKDNWATSNSMAQVYLAYGRTSNDTPNMFTLRCKNGPCLEQTLDISFVVYTCSDVISHPI